MDVVLGELAAERDAGCALEAERRLWNVLALLSPHVTTITTITAAATARTPASIAKVKWCAQAIARAFVYLLPYLRVRQTLAEEYFGLFCQRRSGGDAASNAPLPLRLGIVGILLTFQPALLSALRRQCRRVAVLRDFDVRGVLHDVEVLLRIVSPGFVSVVHACLGLRFARTASGKVAAAAAQGARHHLQAPPAQPQPQLQQQQQQQQQQSLRQLLLAAVLAKTVAGVLKGVMKWRRRTLAQRARAHLLVAAPAHADGRSGGGDTQSAEEQASSSPTCLLCLGPRRHTTCTACGHVACWQCLVTWVQQERCCPLCRQQLRMNQLYPILNLA